MLAVVGVIVVIGALPQPSSPGPSADAPSFDDTVQNKFSDTEDGILRHLLVLHRHGARSAINWYDFEGAWAWADEDVAPGKLTAVGMQQAFAFGQQLRKEYGASLTLRDEDGGVAVDTGAALLDDSVRVVSTDVDRTVDTAHAVLLGLYSPLGTPVTPLPLCACRPDHGKRSAPECLAECLSLAAAPLLPDVGLRGSEDKELHQSTVCKGWSEWKEAMESSAEWRGVVESDFGPAAATVRALTGGGEVTKFEWPSREVQEKLHTDAEDFNYLSFMEGVWSNLECYIADGDEYTKTKANDALLAELQPAANYVWHRQYQSSHGPEASGILLHTWLSKMQVTIDVLLSSQGSGNDAPGATVAQLDMYSAHDVTVFALLAALGAAEDAHLPNFVAHVTFELWQPKGVETAGDFEVRIRYDGELVKDAAGCPGGRCKISALQAGTKDRVRTPDSCETR